MIKSGLHNLLLRAVDPAVLPAQCISKLLRNSVVHLDDTLQSQFISLFPRDLNHLSRMRDQQFRNIFQNHATGHNNSCIARKCLGGATAILSLVDPLKRNLWITNLGGKSYPATES
jgi:pyruvate dehydrogenase phosphatase